MRFVAVSVQVTSDVNRSTCWVIVVFLLPVDLLMQYWFCSTGPVSHYLPWELSTLTFGLYVCVIAHIHLPLFLFSSVRLPQSEPMTWKICPDDFNKTHRYNMWTSRSPLLLPPSLSASLCLHLLLSSFLNLSALLLHFSPPCFSPVFCHCLDGESALSWGNLVPSYEL